MLVWEEDLKLHEIICTRRRRVRRDGSLAVAARRAVRAGADASVDARRPHSEPQSRRATRSPRRRGRRRAPRQRRRQAHHQRPDRRQPAGAVQVQVGVGEVPRHLREPLDAARGQHVARHRALEGPERPDRRRAPHRQAQPRLLRHRRFAGRQQHRARHLPPHHGARVPPVPAAPGVRGSDPHARLPVHRRVARPGRERDLQRVQRGRVDPRQGRVPDPVHRRDHGSELPHRHARERPDAAASR